MACVIVYLRLRVVLLGGVDEGHERRGSPFCGPVGRIGGRRPGGDSASRREGEHCRCGALGRQPSLRASVTSFTMGYLGSLIGRTRTLDSHASRLRRKLNRSSETAYVLNVWGVGYRLVSAAR
jgi:hypothetical protein